MNRDDPLPLTMAASFLQSFAQCFVILGMVYYGADRFHADSAAIGLLASAYTATYALGCLLLNRAVSRLRPYHAVLMGLVMQASLVLMLPRAQTLSGLAVLYLFFGLTTGLIWPPLMGWMSRGRDEKRLSRAISAFNFSWSAPWIIGPYLTGLLYERSPRTPFYSGVIISLGIVALILITLSLRPGIGREGHSEHHLKKQVGTEGDRSTPLRFLGWMSLFSGYLYVGILGSVFPLFLRRHFLLTESAVGRIILIRAGVTLLLFYLMGKTKRWQYNRRLLLLFPLGAALIMGLFTRSQTLFHYILWTALAGTIVGVTYTNSMFHALSGTVERQKRMNIHEIILTAASLTGSLGGGFLLDQYGMNSIILLSALLMLAVFLLQLGVDFFYVRNRIGGTRIPSV